MTSQNFVVKRHHKNVRMMSVVIKMVDINVGNLKVKMDLLKCWHPQYARKRIQHEFVDRLDNSVRRVHEYSLFSAFLTGTHFQCTRV